MKPLPSLTDPPIECILLSQYQEELADYKKDVAALCEELVAMDMNDDDELFTTHSTLERRLSTTSHKIKTLRIVPSTDSRTTDGTGVRLPKRDVPTFDGDIVHWKQFTVAVHSKTNMSNAEKTVYLQHAIKDAYYAKSAIEGFSHSGENYDEAIKCVKSRYDRPRLIHRTHVQLILDVPSLREGSGKELRAYTIPFNITSVPLRRWEVNFLGYSLPR